MADVVPFLLSAYKLMDNKNYVEAKILCEKILQIDPQHYIALAWLGEILGEIHGESDEALECFQRAIGFQPTKLFAWKRLAKYYERNDNSTSKSELLRVYNKILKLQIETDKAEEVICKVAEIGISLKDLYSVGILINYLSTKPAYCLYKFTEQKLLKLINVTVAPDSLRLSIILAKIDKITRDSAQNSMLILLAKIVLMYKNFSQAFHYIVKVPNFSSNVLFRMWYCKYICSYYAQMETFGEVDIEKHYDDIVQGCSNSKYALLLNSMILYNKKKYKEAYIISYPLVNYEQAELHDSLFSVKCIFKNRNWVLAVLTIKTLMLNLKDCKYKLELNKYLFLSLAQQKKWPQALTAARKIPLEMLLVQEQAVLATCYIENGENPERLMKILQPTAYYVQLKALTLIVKKDYIEAINVLQKELAENPVHYSYMARSYWLLKQYELSSSYFLKAAKLEEDNAAESYYYIGKYYEQKSLLSIAQLHYEKAYGLDSSNPKIIKRLSDVYLAQGLEEENYNFLRYLNYRIISIPWVHYHLANYFIENNDWKSAIKHLQFAVEYDNTDIQALELLADAYEADKCIDLAIECLYKIIGLVPTTEAKYLYRIASILNSAERYQEALNIFEKMLHLSPRSLLALKGTNDVNMLLAEMSAKSGHFQLARHAAQKSVIYLITSIGICNKTRINWNMLANAILFIAKLPDNHCYLDIRFDINQELGNLGTINTKINMYKLGYYCFWRAQSFLPSHIERRICRLLASEIFDDELHATLARFTSHTQTP